MWDALGVIDFPTAPRNPRAVFAEDHGADPQIRSLINVNWPIASFKGSTFVKSLVDIP